MPAVVLHRGEDGYWVVECPSLPGCISQGEREAEAIANIKEAIEGLLRACIWGRDTERRWAQPTLHAGQSPPYVAGRARICA